jgi:hypothetical protein
MGRVLGCVLSAKSYIFRDGWLARKAIGRWYFFVVVARMMVVFVVLFKWFLQLCWNMMAIDDPNKQKGRRICLWCLVNFCGLLCMMVEVVISSRYIYLYLLIFVL